MDFNIRIDENKYAIKLYLCKTIKSIENYHNQINMDLDLIHVSLNPRYIISLKALLLAIYQIYSSKKKKQLDSFELQKELSYYLAPEDSKEFKQLTQDDVVKSPSMHIFINIPHEKEKFIDEFMKLNTELDHISELLQYTDLQVIKNLYKITDEEINLDQDARASIYNIIALKKKLK